VVKAHLYPFVVRMYSGYLSHAKNTVQFKPVQSSCLVGHVRRTTSVAAAVLLHQIAFIYRNGQLDCVVLIACQELNIQSFHGCLVLVSML
jgi:hypothetical protein